MSRKRKKEKDVGPRSKPHSCSAGKEASLFQKGGLTKGRQFTLSTSPQASAASNPAVGLDKTVIPLVSNRQKPGAISLCDLEGSSGHGDKVYPKLSCPAGLMIRDHLHVGSLWQACHSPTLRGDPERLTVKSFRAE